jgi:hypothetical protein
VAVPEAPQSGRGLRPKVAVDKCLMHMIFGDNCAASAPRLLRLAESDSPIINISVIAFWILMRNWPPV